MKIFGNRRKVYLINKRFQYAFIFFSSSVAFLSLCIFYFAILYFFWSFEQRGIALGIPSEHIFFRFISEERIAMNKIFIIAALTVVLITTISALVLSHRVAGPLHRLKCHLKQSANDQSLRPVKFRRGDYFGEIEESFNLFINVIKNNYTKNPHDSAKKEKIE